MVCLANGWLLASEILGPGFGGEIDRYVISDDDGLTWKRNYEYYNPGRAIGGLRLPPHRPARRRADDRRWHSTTSTPSSLAARRFTFCLAHPLAKLAPREPSPHESAHTPFTSVTLR